MTSVRVTGVDPGGLTAVQQFDAWSDGSTPPVPNPNVPHTTESIPSIRLPLGETATIDLSQHFSFWGAMAFDVASSSDAASISTSGEVAVVPPSAPPNRWPMLAKCIDERVMPWFATVREGVSVYFVDPDGGPLTYDVKSEDSDIVDVTMTGSTLTLYGRSNERGAFVEVTATDSGGLFATLRYFVRRSGADHYGARRCRSEDTAALDRP
ncbi:MAG: hypothetical protein F4Y74_13385 [Gemmatimonadales bacterium]|nr:hypothetical protein [Gemmatimonadales bacterium]